MSLPNLYSFQFGNFSFGNGTPYAITEVTGLEDLPTIRNQDDNKGYNDGMFSGRDFYGSRTITFTIKTLAGNGNSAFINYNLLQAALNPQQFGTTPLQFQLSPDDATRTIDARVRSRATPVNPDYTFGMITSQVTMFCPDPRYYDADQALNLSLAVPPGRTYNRTYNLNFNGGSQTNQGVITNAGWAVTNPVITITGPCSYPTVTNVTTNQMMSINYVMGAFDVVVIDLNLKTVTLNGSTARNILAPGSQWWNVQPGNNTIVFNATTFTLGVTACNISYASAYV